MKPRLDRDLCTACHACVSVCPTQAISMSEDDLGFLRPQIDETACVECGRCEKTCDKVKALPPCPQQTVYAARHRSIDVVKSSASGGVFTALSDSVLAEGGAVVGARYNEHMTVAHTVANTPEERDALRGSKYTYSLCDRQIFVQVRQLLDEGQTVLFSGTPCQVAALHVFLGKAYERLLTVDILCHGIAAPVLYRDYVAALEQKGDVAYIDFRYTPDGNWHDPKTCVTYQNGAHRNGEAENAYFRMFVRNYCLRESCYQCHYASFDRVSDITLGDFWGIENSRPELDAPHGVSVVTVNTPKGAARFEQIRGDLHAEPCDPSACSHDQLNGLKPGGRNAAFVEDYRQHGYDYVRRKYVTTPLSIRLREKLYRSKWIRALRDNIMR